MGKVKNSMWNSLKVWLAGTLAAGSLLIPNICNAGGVLRVSNLTTNTSVNKDYVLFSTSSLLYGTHPPVSNPKLSIYCDNGDSNEYTQVPVDVSTNMTFKNLLRFDCNPK